MQAIFRLGANDPLSAAFCTSGCTLIHKSILQVRCAHDLIYINSYNRCPG
ncbi:MULTISPECIES: hypothetical protein [unclassified Pseudomonas]|nr:MULTISPECIES: hypothetical protein [unclassified Pseudomonas]EJM83423.1 hypothetical protein PMI32_02211 [Pseudomonas sp. GM60]